MKNNLRIEIIDKEFDKNFLPVVTVKNIYKDEDGNEHSELYNYKYKDLFGKDNGSIMDKVDAKTNIEFLLEKELDKDIEKMIENEGYTYAFNYLYNKYKKDIFTYYEVYVADYLNEYIREYGTFYHL